MKISDIINEVIESEEMKKYLCDNISLLTPWQIQDIIAGAPILLTRKQYIFHELIKIDPESYKEMSMMIDDALAALYSNKKSIFEVYYGYRKSDGIDYSSSEIFLSLEKAMSDIQNKIYPEDFNRSWVIIKKWDCDNDDNLVNTYIYCLLHGNICYAQENCDRNIDAWMHGSLNLPVPFKSGDFVTMNGYPFAKETTAVILDIGDNSDCCSVKILCIDDNAGHYTQGPLKHDCAFTWDCSVAISPLYRIKTITPSEMYLKLSKQYQHE